MSACRPQGCHTVTGQVGGLRASRGAALCFCQLRSPAPPAKWHVGVGGAISRPVMPPTSVEILGAVSSRALYFPKTADRLCPGQCCSHSYPAHGASLAAAALGTSLHGPVRAAGPSCRSAGQGLGALLLLWRPLSHWVILGRELGHSGLSVPRLYKGKDNWNICRWAGPENSHKAFRAGPGPEVPRRLVARPERS